MAELDPSAGKTMWLRQYGPSDSLSSLAIDQSGDLIVSGVSGGDFPGTANGVSTPFAVKLDGSTGNVLWTQAFSSLTAKGYLSINQVTVAPDGSLVLGGAISAQKSVVIGYGADPSAEMWVGRLKDGSGSMVGSTEIGTGGGVQFTSLAVGPEGDVYASGVTNGPLAAGAPSSTRGAFLLKFSSSLAPQWVESVGNGPIHNVAGLMSGPEILFLNGDVVLGAVMQGSNAGFSNPDGDVEMLLAGYGS